MAHPHGVLPRREPSELESPGPLRAFGWPMGTAGRWTARARARVVCMRTSVAFLWEPCVALAAYSGSTAVENRKAGQGTPAACGDET